MAYCGRDRSDGFIPEADGARRSPPWAPPRQNRHRCGGRWRSPRRGATTRGGSHPESSPQGLPRRPSLPKEGSSRLGEGSAPSSRFGGDRRGRRPAGCLLMLVIEHNLDYSLADFRTETVARAAHGGFTSSAVGACGKARGGSVSRVWAKSLRPTSSNDYLLEHLKRTRDVGVHGSTGCGFVPARQGIHHSPVVPVGRDVVARRPEKIEVGADLKP